MPSFTQIRRFPPRTVLAAASLLLLLGLTAGSSFSAQTGDPPLTAQKPAASEKSEPVDPQADAKAKATLKQAQERLAGYSSIQADLVESVMIGMRKYRAEGRYLQGPDREVRLEFQVTSKGQDGQPLTGALLQISDGSILHSSYLIGSDRRVTRQDLKQIKEAIDKYGAGDVELQSAQLGIGGLPALLASIENAMKFDRVDVEEIKGVRYVVLYGGWSPEYVKSAPLFKQYDIDDPASLPVYVPDRIRVYLDEQTLFPRRIFYLKTEDGKHLPMMTLDFLNVRTNVPVGNDEFVFVPPEGAAAQDVTQQIIQSIKARTGAETKTSPEKAN